MDQKQKHASVDHGQLGIGHSHRGGAAGRRVDHRHLADAADIYELGRYLERYKYRYLRLSYLSFLVGIIAGCLLEGAYLILR
jgi:hypothetical protein